MKTLDFTHQKGLRVMEKVCGCKYRYVVGFGKQELIKACEKHQGEHAKQ